MTPPGYFYQNDGSGSTKVTQIDGRGYDYYYAELQGDGLMTSLGPYIDPSPPYVSANHYGRDYSGWGQKRFSLFGGSEENELIIDKFGIHYSGLAVGMKDFTFKEIAYDGNEGERVQITGVAELTQISAELPDAGDTPEPATLLLLGPALGWMAWRRRKHSRDH